MSTGSTIKDYSVYEIIEFRLASFINLHTNLSHDIAYCANFMQTVRVKPYYSRVVFSIALFVENLDYTIVKMEIKTFWNSKCVNYFW